jgi:hypothetical protein
MKGTFQATSLPRVPASRCCGYYQKPKVHGQYTYGFQSSMPGHVRYADYQGKNGTH